jgi:hypothetical protein
MSVIWSWTYFYYLHWNNYLYFKSLLYIWEEMIMMALLHMASQISEKYWCEVGKGKRADVYLEVRNFLNETSACATTLEISTLTSDNVALFVLYQTFAQEMFFQQMWRDPLAWSHALYRYIIGFTEFCLKYTLTSSSSGKCVCFGRGLTCGIA